MGLYSPSFFAARVSKPLESFSVSSLCSEVIVCARARRAGGMDSGDAASGALATCRSICIEPLTRTLQTNATTDYRPAYTRKAVATYPGRCEHSREQVKSFNCDGILSFATRIPIGTLARDVVPHARKGLTA